MAVNKAISSAASSIETTVLSAVLLALAEKLSDGICIIDSQGKVSYANASLMSMLGLNAEDVLGKNFQEIVATEQETVAKFMTSGNAELFECAFHSSGSIPILTRCSTVPIKAEPDAYQGTAILVQDITSQRVAEVTSARLAAIVEASDDAIVSKDLSGIIQTWNKGAEEVFGYSAEEVIGKPIHILLPEDRKGEENLILDRLRKGHRIDHYETVRRRKDGKLIDISVTVSPILNPQGIVIAASKVARDITRRKLAELALAQSQAALQLLTNELEQRVRERTAELEQANKEMEGFTYSVSHDLRAPLRAIVSSSRVIIEDFGEHLPADAKEHLERQEAAAEKMATLIDELLQLSRVSRSNILLKDVDLSELASSIVLEIKKSEPESPVTFAIQPNMRAYGDSRLLRLLLLNLMDNARKFSPEGGMVSIGCREVDDHSVYYVKDHGIGFDMKYVEKTFQPFERLVHEMEFPGTGIGLANAQRIIERHNGSIWAESALGKGSTFFFKLGGQHNDSG